MEIKDLTLEQIGLIESAKSLEELKAAAGEQGIVATDEEISLAWKSLHEQDAIEISEDELENIAGGCGGGEQPGPKEHDVWGSWEAPCVPSRFMRVRIRLKSKASCGDCIYFTPKFPEQWNGPGKCLREFK